MDAEARERERRREIALESGSTRKSASERSAERVRMWNARSEACGGVAALSDELPAHAREAIAAESAQDVSKTSGASALERRAKPGGACAGVRCVLEAGVLETHMWGGQEQVGPGTR